LGLDINFGIEEELSHYQFSFSDFIFSFYLLDQTWKVWAIRFSVYDSLGWNEWCMWMLNLHKENLC